MGSTVRTMAPVKATSLGTAVWIVRAEMEKAGMEVVFIDAEEIEDRERPEDYAIIQTTSRRLRSYGVEVVYRKMKD